MKKTTRYEVIKDLYNLILKNKTKMQWVYSNSICNELDKLIEEISNDNANLTAEQFKDIITMLECLGSFKGFSPQLDRRWEIIRNTFLIINNCIYMGDTNVHCDNVFAIRSLRNGDCLFYMDDKTFKPQEDFTCDINSIFKRLMLTGHTNFVTIKNAIINLNKIDYLWLEDYKDCDSTLLNYDKKIYDLYSLMFAFKDGRVIGIDFETSNEAEKLYHEIDSKLADLRSAELTCN